MIADSLVLYCRAGFEKDCAAEISETAAAHGLHGYARTQPGDGFVVYRLHEPQAPARLSRSLRWDRLVFARQLVFSTGRVDGLPVADRVRPLLDAAKALGTRFSACHVESADSEPGKLLSGFCRGFSTHYLRALKSCGLLQEGQAGAPGLHLFFLDSATCYPGISLPGNASPWPQGIVRLRMPRAAPSRSALKLAEALLIFLDEAQRAQRLRPGMRAVDLGAAPGGWSWQLARRGVHVTAVDNGPLDERVLATEMVEHVRADGFTWRPRRPVDWLVCDMVEQPGRVAALVAEWVATGHCRDALFNLKLPMKRRLEEVHRCREAIEKRLGREGRVAELQMKQLYHDREEVSAYLRARSA